MDRKKTVLIVEDEKSIVDILRFNLEKDDYAVETAYDGEAGLRLAVEKNPDLVLLDLMLPKMNGFDVCRRLREKGSNVPIIILTAPIVFPIAESLGIDRVHFGVITVVNLAFGLFTPPFGTCVFMANSYSKQPVTSIVKECRWFYVFGLGAIFLVTYVPDCVLWILNFVSG